MMIPPFNDFGFLPEGVHPATMAEITSRFGESSEIRRVQMESLLWLVDLAFRAGVQRIILNGSFVTDIMEPNDVDCVLLMAPSAPKDLEAFREVRAGLPFIHAIIVRKPQRFESYIREVFGSDRFGTPKGVIEVVP